MTDDVTGAADAAAAEPVVPADTGNDTGAEVQSGESTKDDFLSDESLEAVVARIEKEQADEAAETKATAPKGPERDEQGKFKAKTEQAKTEQTAGAEKTAAADRNADQSQAGQGEPSDGDAIAAPQSWSAEMKEKWGTVSPEVRGYIAQRETEAHSEITRLGREAARLKPLGELVNGKQGTFDRHGLSAEEGIQMLLEAQDRLDSDPLAAIQAIAQSYRVDLAAHYGGQASGQGNGQQGHSPEFVALQQKVATLTNQLNQRETQEQARARRDEDARLAETRADLETWGKDKPHFARDDIKSLMAGLLRSGAAKGRDDAYEQACYAIPEVRATLLAAQRKADEDRQRAEQAAAVTDAKKVAANGSKRTGTPTKGKTWDDEDALSALHDRIAASG